MLLPLCHHHLSYPLNPLPDHRNHPSIHSSSFSTIPKTLLSSNPKLSRPLLATCALKSQTRPESAIKRIADKLRSLGYLEADEDHHHQHQRPPSPQPHESQPEPDGSGSAGEIFVPLRSHLPKVRVGHTLDSSWSRPENPVPAPGSGTLMGRLYELGNEVKRQMHTKQEKEEEGPTRAQEMLSPEEIRRLQRIGIGIKKKVKVGKAGITEGIVNGIHERWRRTELVRIACEDICRINMKRTHDILERKSGGLVIWRSGSNVILYRGPNYKYPYFLNNSLLKNGNSSGSASIPHEEDGVQCEKEIFLSGPDGSDSVGPNLTESVSRGSLIKGVGYPDRVRFRMPGEAELAEEADQLLDGLGPRFTDWWGSDPPPVDADLLPPVVPGYRRPFRLLPYGVKPKLTNDEMTTLKRLGRPIPCHFALGRNRKHQGLAASIIKLWERCEIAKIAVKRGFQNTNSELMAEELKQLTGGTLLSRDKYFIVLYRGKDFLPPAVSSAIEERRKHGIESKKCKEDRGSLLKRGTIDHASRAERKLQATRVVISRTNAILSRALEKKAAAEKIISEIENRQLPLQADVDKEGITEEERYMLRKVGIRMKPFLLMGKRGVFSGTVENMHLHWKYRELVKVLCSEKNNRDALDVARTLEAESGGILVAVERVRKGYAIIVYRGKNYERPANLRPQTLLTKRQAMKRAIEAQRHQSLKLHVLKLTRNIEDLKQRLDKEMSMISSKKEAKPQLVDAEEVNDKPKTENEKLDFELETEYHSHFIVPSYNEESGEVVEHDSVNIGDGVYASSDSLEISQCDELGEFHCSENENELEDFNINDGMHASRDSLKLAQHDDLEELFCSESKNEPEESNVTEPQSSSVSVFEEHSNINIDVENGDLEPTSYPANFKPCGQANWSNSKNASGQLLGNEKLGSLGYSVDISDGMNASTDGLEITQLDEPEEFRCSENENDLKDFNISHGMHTSRDSLEMAQHDEPEEPFSSPVSENELEESHATEQWLSFVSVSGKHLKINIDAEKGDVNPTSCSENFKPQGQANWSTSKNVSGQLSGNGKLEPLAEVDNELGPSTCEGIGNRPYVTTFKASKLSNRDRLLLRKQALKMRKRPVLAVGRSNVVSGVAKAIALHFERYPLAIVNVKARAKGTPIQELVFKLEQATGAVLVSQEINKVILYRGWGAGDESWRTSKAQHASKHSVWRRIEAPAMVSPELMDAIRAECGLQHKQKEEKTLGS